MNQLERMAAGAARQHLQNVFKSLHALEEQMESRIHQMRDANGERFKTHIAFLVQECDSLKGVFAEMSEVNNWLLAMEKP